MDSLVPSVKWFDEVVLGDTVTLTRTITEADAALYIAATGDFGPIHVDAEYARSTRFGERIAPGIMIGAMATSVLTSQLLGPLGVSIEDTFRFKGPVRYGDTITLEIRISRKFDDKRIVEWTATGTNQRGETVLEIQAVAKFPRRRSDAAGHPPAVPEVSTASAGEPPPRDDSAQGALVVRPSLGPVTRDT